MTFNPKCKHNGTFYCDWIMEAGNYQFVCALGCGHYMQYDPRQYPTGVWFPEFPEMKGKILPPLTSHEVSK
jgi:hypothetical protein